jgi:hypothetical protein
MHHHEKRNRAADGFGDAGEVQKHNQQCFNSL